MLEVHAPHEPIRTWQSFFVHIATIVIGLLIAISLEQTVELLHHRQQGKLFTERLKADLRVEVWGWDMLIAYNQEVLASANLAVNALEGKAVLSDEALLINAYRATQYKNRPHRRSTYDELISTGSIGLIGDHALRSAAIALYTTQTLDELPREGRDSHFREVFRMSIPIDVQRTLRKQCGDREVGFGDISETHSTLNYPCSTGLSGQAISDAAKAIRSNTHLLETLRLRISDLETRLFDLNVNNNNKDVLERLRALTQQAP